MNPLKVPGKKERAEIEGKLKRQFGVFNLPGEIFMRGKDKMFLFSGSFDFNKVKELERNVVIERLGVYFAKLDEKTGDLRLSIEGSQILKPNKNVFEINASQAEEWMLGRELGIKTGKKGFLAMKYGNDFLGTGKASDEKIGNFVPKNRRLKEKS